MFCYNRSAIFLIAVFNFVTSFNLDLKEPDSKKNETSSTETDLDDRFNFNLKRGGSRVANRNGAYNQVDTLDYGINAGIRRPNGQYENLYSRTGSNMNSYAAGPRVPLNDPYSQYRSTPNLYGGNSGPVYNGGNPINVYNNGGNNVPLLNGGNPTPLYNGGNNVPLLNGGNFAPVGNGGNLSPMYNGGNVGPIYNPAGGNFAPGLNDEIRQNYAQNYNQQVAIPLDNQGSVLLSNLKERDNNRKPSDALVFS